MSRKSVLVGTGILLLLVVGAPAGLLLLARHEPAFYRRAAVPPGPERASLSGAFASRAYNLKTAIQEADRWGDTFGDEEFNSFFQEDFVKSGAHEFTLPSHITDPRVVFEADRIRLGFRYHVGGWSTVVAIDMRIWLAAREPNVIALELQGMRAGALPVSSQSLLERLTETADANNIKLSWYRRNGNPVAVLRFQTDQPVPTVQLEQLELRPGELSISGRSAESRPAAVAAPEAKR